VNIRPAGVMQVDGQKHPMLTAASGSIPPKPVRVRPRAIQPSLDAPGTPGRPRDRASKFDATRVKHSRVARPAASSPGIFTGSREGAVITELGPTRSVDLCGCEDDDVVVVASVAGIEGSAAADDDQPGGAGLGEQVGW